jgi:hypothetical protein
VVVDQFKHSIVRDGGPLEGRKQYTFKYSNDDKIEKLTLSNPTTRETKKIVHAIVDDPNDPFSTYKLLYHHLTQNLPPGHHGRVFLHPYCDSVHQKRSSEGLPWPANTLPRSTTDNTEAGKMGKNYLNKICKSVAEHCRFDNAHLFTGRSCRKGGIVKMSSTGVPTGEMMAAARHKSISVSNEYQTCNPDTGAMRHAAFARKEKVIW